MEKSKGVIEILETFWKGNTKAYRFSMRFKEWKTMLGTFFLISTVGIPGPVITRYELGSAT